MTKSELIAELAISNPHLRVADVELIVTTIFDQNTAALAQGGRVELRGFGAFTMRRRNTRMGHNPRTGEAVSVKEKMRPFFKAGKELRVRLNRKPSRPASAHHSTNVPNKREPLGVSRAPAKGHPRNNGTWMCIAAPHLGLLPGRPLPGGGGHRLHHPERGVGNDRGTGRDGPGSAPPPPPATPRPSLMRSPRIGPARVSRPPARTLRPAGRFPQPSPCHSRISGGTLWPRQE